MRMIEIVTKKYLEIGEVAAAGQAIVSVADVSLFKIAIEIPDYLTSRISLGIQAYVILDGVFGEYGAKITKTVCGSGCST